MPKINILNEIEKNGSRCAKLLRNFERAELTTEDFKRAKNHMGETALHLILDRSEGEKILELVEYIVFLYPQAVKIKNKNGKLPIHYMPRKRNNGANKEQEMERVQRDQLEARRFLMNKYPGALKIKTHDLGWTPIDSAKYYKCHILTDAMEEFQDELASAIKENGQKGSSGELLIFSCFDKCQEFFSCCFKGGQERKATDEAGNSRTTSRSIMPSSSSSNLDILIEIEKNCDNPRQLLQSFKNKNMAGMKNPDEDEYNETPLHYVMWFCHGQGILELVEYLVDCDPEWMKATNKNGILPIHCMPTTNDEQIQKDQLEARRFLMQEFPDGLKIKNQYGRTPLEAATKTGRYIIAEAIEEFIGGRHVIADSIEEYHAASQTQPDVE